MFAQVARRAAQSTRTIKLIFHHFRKNVTGTKEQTPRWRICTGTASGSFSSPLGNMYVTKHFNEAAKHAMMEMVRDIRGEFNNILRWGSFVLSQTDSIFSVRTELH